MPSPARRRLSPDERSAQIDAAAVALARADGLAGLTLRSVAAAIGVAPSLVAHYRPAMESLVADTFRTVATTEVAEVTQAVRAAPDPVGQLAALLAAVNDPARDDVGTIWADAWSIGRTNEPLADAARAVMDAWQALASQVVADGVAAGVMRTDDPDRVAFLLFALVDAANGYALVDHRSRAERDDLVLRTVAAAVGLPRERLTAGG